MSRQLDLLVAEHVMRFTVRRVRPTWYTEEVTLFYVPGDPLIAYSYDENSCNAMMHRNGVDGTDGTAPPLPGYSCEISAAFDVMEQVRYNPKFKPQAGWWLLNAEESAEAVCRAALRAVGLSPIQVDEVF